MSYSVAQAASPADVRDLARGGNAWRLAVALASTGLLWFEVVNHLGREWTMNAQYSYGWTVPFLVLYLLCKRWPDRPAPVGSKWRSGTILVAVLCALPLLPARIVS
ncbi:MAG: archaeosortase/exosortase family protein, partial [Chthoniobacterales bacterium]